MKRDIFIKHFLRITEDRLNKYLPEKETEGVLIFKTYQLMSRTLSHILNTKLNVNGEDNE